MADDQGLWAFVVAETAMVGVAFVLVVDGVFGTGGFLTSASRPLQLGVLGFLALELLIPVGVYLDVRWNALDMDHVWVHAAAMPVINVVGLIAYLEARKRATEE